MYVSDYVPQKKMKEMHLSGMFGLQTYLMDEVE